MYGDMDLDVYQDRYLYRETRINFNAPITSVKTFEDQLPKKEFEHLLDSHEFTAEGNFFLDLEEDSRVWFKVGLIGKLRCDTALEIIKLYNTSKAQRRARYVDRIEANPTLWESLMPMIKTPLRDLCPAKVWLGACLEAGAGVEDLVALMQLYNEFAEIAGDYPRNPEIVDQLAPWTTPGRFFDLERDLEILRKDFQSASGVKAKRVVLKDAQEKYTQRHGYPLYFVGPMEARIHELYRTLEKKR